MNLELERFERFSAQVGFPECKVHIVASLDGGSFTAVGVHEASGKVEVLEVLEDGSLRSLRHGEIENHGWEFLGIQDGSCPMLMTLLCGWVSCHSEGASCREY
jgi:hypothetical protein